MNFSVFLIFHRKEGEKELQDKYILQEIMVMVHESIRFVVNHYNQHVFVKLLITTSLMYNF